MVYEHPVMDSGGGVVAHEYVVGTFVHVDVSTWEVYVSRIKDDFGYSTGKKFPPIPIVFETFLLLKGIHPKRIIGFHEAYGTVCESHGPCTMTVKKVYTVEVKEG